MRADFGVVLDACVMVPMPLADTLFRMAEEPRLHLPRWTDEIMAEVSRNLVSKLNRTPEQASHGEEQIRKAPAVRLPAIPGLELSIATRKIARRYGAFW